MSLTYLAIRFSNGPSDLLFAFNCVTLVVYLVCYSVLHHRWWAVLPEDERRTTPTQAIGLCFAPLFNLYWFIPAYVGLVTDLRAAAKRRGVDLELNETHAWVYLAGWYYVPLGVALIGTVRVIEPWLDIPLTLASGIIAWAFVSRTSRAVGALAWALSKSVVAP